jgi:hypothetical protein
MKRFCAIAILTSLLPTLVSRSRVLRFSRVPDRELEPWLEGVAPEDRRFLLMRAQGAPGIIKRLRDDPDALRTERSLYGEAAAFWEASSLSARLKMLLPLHERGDAADQFLLHLGLALREELQEKDPRAAVALARLMRGLQTNVSRQLLTQQFAMSVE